MATVVSDVMNPEEALLLLSGIGLSAQEILGDFIGMGFEITDIPDEYLARFGRFININEQSPPAH